MATFNQVLILGNLTRDPESRTIPNGTLISSFAIAVSRKYKDNGGQQKEEVSFVDCEAWAKTAELVMNYLKKGKSVLVQGRLKQDRWQTPEGQNRNKLKVVVDNIQFLGPKTQDGGGAAPADPQAEAGTTGEAWGDADVPF